MPPRYAYWTILVDGQPTAFRASMQEDLLPTFKRLKQKHPAAEMKWFQNGKLWNSRLDAQEAMRERGERGRAGDVRQGGYRDRAGDGGSRDRAGDARHGGSRDRAGDARQAGYRDRKRSPETRDFKAPRPPRRQPNEKLEWKPKGEFTPAPKRSDRSERPDRPAWRPKGGAPPAPRPEWKRRDEGPKPKLDWRPRGKEAPAKREEFAKRKPAARAGSGRDKNWRPGGDHKDPRQKYKDAKKAKWQRFKKAIRTRWESKGPKKS